MTPVDESTEERAAELRRSLRSLIGESPLVYVDCGARGGKLPRAFREIRGSRYIGFEADQQECARMNAGARPHHRYLAAFLDATSRQRTFRITASPACASLLEPNHPLLAPFAGVLDGFAVEQETMVETIGLEQCLAAEGIAAIDFLELDTQGTELDILTGAQSLLDGSIVGLQVEVEFAPLYVGQPLFGDVDSFLRARGFQLFDLSRYRVRRTASGASGTTRGQLLWGHAAYLRSVERVASDGQAARLAVVAALTGFPDYAAEVLGRLAAANNTELRQKAARAMRALVAGTPPADRPAIWRD